MNEPKPTLTAERLRELLNYDPETGVFTNRVTRGSMAIIGAVAGHIAANFYVQIRLDDKLYYGHRLAWLYTTGSWPANVIDHKDLNPSNNRFSNLRDVPQLLNQQNRRVPMRNGTTGFLGVYLNKRRNHYCSQIRVKGRTKYLGAFATPEAAHSAYVVAKRKLHDGCTL
jgi:hypothetical protein